MNMLKEVFERVKDIILENNEVELNGSLLEILIKVSFIRNIEYNQFIQSLDSQSSMYFCIPFLRGLVEDIIVLNYLKEKIEVEDQEVIIKYLMVEDVIKSTEKQNKFFEKERDNQPILTNEILQKIYPSNIYKSQISTLKKKYLWKKNFPTVFQMAEEANLIELYNYFYHATSRLVHFNPQLLLKLAWGESESCQTDGLKKVTKFKVSTSNFAGYYEKFGSFYGSFLFLKSFELYKEFNQVTDDLLNAIKEIEALFKDNKRWPELITFEEMNIPLEEGIKMYDLEKGGFDQYIGRVFYKLLMNNKR